MTQQPNKFSALRQRAEKLLVSSEVSSTPDSIDAIRAVFNELDTYQIELELQNDELLNTQKRLQEVYQDYLNLYNLAPVAYATLDDDSRILNANNFLATLLGLSKQQLLSQPFTDYVLESDQDILYLYRQALCDNQNPKACELRLCNKSGQILWIKCEGFFKNVSSVHEINLVITDITELRHTMNALCDSENRHRLSQVYGGIGVWEANLINNRQIWSDNCRQLLGFPSLENPTWEDFLMSIYPEDRAVVINATKAHN